MNIKTIKRNFIASTFPVISLITFGIYPLVMSIMLFLNYDRFKNIEICLACAISALLGIPLFLFIPFIMGFILKPKSDSEIIQMNKNEEKLSIID